MKIKTRVNSCGLKWEKEGGGESCCIIYIEKGKHLNIIETLQCYNGFYCKEY